MKKILKALVSLILLLPVLYFVIINIKLTSKPSFKEFSGVKINNTQLKHLRFIKSKMDKGADGQMQALYPEGYVFMNALYGLAWADFLEGIPKEHDLLEEGQIELKRVWQNLDTDEARLIFPEYQQIEFGAYYTGWTAYFLGKKLALETEKDSSEIKEFVFKCEEIAAAATNPYPYSSSYKNMIWPADITTGIAALALHDKIFEPKFKDAISFWLNNVKQNLDDSGMVPHEIHLMKSSIAETEKMPIQARGSSMSLMLCFLNEIDPEFSREQFKLYKEHFLDKRFGLYGIREHRKGVSLGSDIDSGPVLLGIGGSASIVGRKALAMHGDYETANGIRGALEGWGVSWEGKKNKRYIAGVLPMADVFIAWANGVETEESRNLRPSFLWFRFLSLLVILIFGGMVFWLWRKE